MFDGRQVFRLHDLTAVQPFSVFKADGMIREQIPEELKRSVPDYKINVVEVAWMPEKKMRLFKSDFRFVAEYLVKTRLHKEYKPSDEEIRHVASHS